MQCLAGSKQQGKGLSYTSVNRDELTSDQVVTQLVKESKKYQIEGVYSKADN